MRNELKKSIVIMMAIALILPHNVMANEETNDAFEEEIEEYVNVKKVTTFLTINQGIASCWGKNEMKTTHNSKITMTLQKSTDKSSYSKVTSWSQNYTGTGTKILSKTEKVTKGYYYRVKVVVKIYSGSEVIERIKVYSTVVKY